ncbi:hypothetical protein [Saccharopolyspora griseoalba]|uniref:Secreted protein n=1 Tax=Saccharopolyspora griseoalba TaxID=1431848 RepID=A0ABW2LTR0_9PSEU
MLAAGMALAVSMTVCIAPSAGAEDQDAGLLGDLLAPLTPKPPPVSPPLPSMGSPPKSDNTPPRAVVDLSADPSPGPGRQWSLQATRMTLQEPRLHGITTTRIAGREVHVLRISTTGIDLHQPVQRARLGSTGAGLRISAARGQVRPAHAGGRMAILVRQLSGTLDVAGQPIVPVLLAAPPLQAEVDERLLQLPSLALTDVTVHAAALTGSTVDFNGAAISIGH